ncbi:MAG: exopolysaccharide biosynthesis protein [Pseudomonadota bacterium]
MSADTVSMASSHPNVRDLRTLLSSLKTCTDGETVTVDDLLNAVGRRAFGPLLLLLGFISISPLTVVPGATWLVALVTLLIAGQVALGFERPWLPKKALQMEFPRSALVKGVDSMRKTAYTIDQLLQPRICFLTRSPFIQLIALIAVAAALVTFPLGLVPFGPVLPGLAVMFIGLGVTSRDGVMVLLAGGSLIGSFIIVAKVIERLF